MVHMEPDAAYDALQRQAFTLKLLEIGKVLMSWSILKRPDQVMNAPIPCIHLKITDNFSI